MRAHGHLFEKNRKIKTLKSLWFYYVVLDRQTCASSVCEYYSFQFFLSLSRYFHFYSFALVSPRFVSWFLYLALKFKLLFHASFVLQTFRNACVCVCACLLHIMCIISIEYTLCASCTLHFKLCVFDTSAKPS